MSIKHRQNWTSKLNHAKYPVELKEEITQAWPSSTYTARRSL